MFTRVSVSTLFSKQQGKRAWLIGSGSSIKDTQLELLNGEIVWTMNRAHIYYPVGFRPTFYLFHDHNSCNPPEYWMDCIEAHRDTPKYVWSVFRDGYPESHPNHADIPRGIGEVPNTVWIDRCAHHYYSANNYVKRAESWHLPEFCTAFSGMGTMMQAAVANGATEIYLLGCDGYEADYSKNHAVADYTHDTRDRSDHDNSTMKFMHEVARRSSPVPIFDCSLGRGYGVHPKRDMKEVLNG